MATDQNNVKYAILLVGGKGTRLYPLTKECPKPMVLFGGNPIIEYTLELLSNIGVDVVILCLNYYANVLQDVIPELERKYNLSIKCCKEDEALDTAGPLRLASKRYPEILNEKVILVFNCDLYTTINLKELVLRFFQLKEEQDCICLMATTNVENPKNYGCLEIKGDKIVEFLEKPQSENEIKSNLINAGIYCISPEIFSLIEKGRVSAEKVLFPKIVKMGKLCHFLIKNAIWFDIGNPIDYLRAQEIYLKLKNPSNSNNNVFLGSDVNIGENTILENCTIMSDTVIYSNCIVKNAIIGFNCIIMENSRIGDYEKVTVIGNNIKIGGLKTLIVGRIDTHIISKNTSFCK